MSHEIIDLYLYLAKRNKTGIRIIARLTGQSRSPVLLDKAGLFSLQLPSAWHTQISNTIYENRMLWEPWIESVESFEYFRDAVKKRGYTNIPVSSQPEYTMSAVLTQVVNLSYLPKNQKMLRKI